MSAFTNREGGSKTFTNIVGGNFAVRVKEGTANAVTRVTKTHKTVHELLFNTMERVRISKIEKKEGGEYGPNWEITLKKADETIVLNLPYSGRTTNGLFHRLPNLKLDEDVTLCAFQFENKKTPGTFNQYLTVEQGGKKVDSYFTKVNEDKSTSNINGLPPMEKKVIKNKDVWDDTEQMIFIEKMLNETIIPKLSDGAPKISSEDLEPSIDQPESDDPNDDLPF